MKFKVTKKEKETFDALQDACTNFENVEGSVFTLFSLGEDFGGCLACGDFERITAGFFQILKDGLSKECGEEYRDAAFSILRAMELIIQEHDEESILLADIIADIFRRNTIKKCKAHEEKEKKSERQDDDEIEVEIIVEDSACIITDKDKKNKHKDAKIDEETFEQLAAKLDKMGYYVSKKPTKKGNPTKKESDKE